MRASHTHMPPPLPLPLPPPPLSLPSTPSTVPRRRHRTACSSTSSSSSVSTISPSPSPARTAATTSVVPFSWERHPGIPKSSLAGLMMSSGVSGSAPLPLPPPPLRRPSPRHRRQRRRRRADDVLRASADRADPFAAAFAECTRPEVGTHGDGPDTLYPPSSTVSGRAGRPWWLAGGGVIGLLDLYGCKSAIAVADGAFLPRRPAATRR